MATIVTRAGLGSPLSNNQVDSNFTNLNTDKAELSGATFTGQIVAPSLDISGNIDVDGTTNLDVVDIDGAVDMASTLQVDGAATFTTEITANGGIALGDNDKATFGDGDDLQIYHGGGHSYIRDEGTGGLILTTNGAAVYIQKGDTETSAEFNIDGAVKLRYDNAQKFATTSTGIDVTGTATMDGLTVDGTNGNFEVSTTGNSVNMTRAGNNFITASDAVGDLFLGAGGVNCLKIDNGGDISFYEDTGTTPKLVWDASAESLGIGTDPSSYSNTLVADQGGNYTGLHNQAAILVRASTGTAGVGNHQGAISFSQGTGQAAISGVQESSDNDVLGLAFWTHDSGTGTAAAVERMRIDNQGRVGIGTSSPSDFAANANNLVVGSGSGTEGITINSGTANYGVIYFADGTSGSAAYAGNINYNHADNSMRLGTNGSTTDVVINSSGNVGIGTTDPNEPLTVSGNTLTYGSTGNVGSGVSLFFGNNSNSRDIALTRVASGSLGIGRYSGGWQETARFDSSGNVGIGTSSPSALLEVSGGTQGVVITQSDTARNLGYYAQIKAPYAERSFEINVNNNKLITAGGYMNATSLMFHTADTERMRILSDGSCRWTPDGTNHDMTLTASGDLLVGKTATGTGTVGAELRASGFNAFVRDGGEVMNINRLSSDGTIISVRKQSQEIGSIGTDIYGELVFGSGDTGLGFQAGNDAIIPRNTDGTARTQLINLGTSGAQFKDLYLSSGVYLGGTGAANKLDDYEEGTWTPTASSSITIGTVESATYTKVGNSVSVTAWLRVTTTSSAGFIIAGLPFAVSDRANAAISDVTNGQAISNQLVSSGIYGYNTTTSGTDKLYFISATYPTNA